MTPLHYHQSKKRTIYYLVVIWSISIILALPNIFFYEFKYIKDTALGIKPYCTTFDPSFTKSILEEFQLVHTIVNEGTVFKFTNTYQNNYNNKLTSYLSVFDFLSIWNLIFAGYTGSKNQVWNRQKIKLKNQVKKSISWNRDFKKSSTDR